MLLVEDRALLDAFRRGERAALERVYREYVQSVARLLRRGFSFSSGGRRHHFRGFWTTFDLEDRLHEVFARAFSERARTSYDGLTSYKAYLLAIARNLVIDEFRQKADALLEFSLDAEGEPSATTADLTAEPQAEPLTGDLEPRGNPPADIEAAEVVGLVKIFRAQLSPREQEIFRLRFEEEREHKEIAEMTRLSPSQIKTSEQRIREAFFEFMNGRGYFQGYRRARKGWLAPLFGMLSLGS